MKEILKEMSDLIPMYDIMQYRYNFHVLDYIFDIPGRNGITLDNCFVYLNFVL